MNAHVHAGAHAAAQLSGDVAEMVEAVACASAACLAEVRDQLLVEGDIKVEDEPELEDVESDDDGPEEDLGDGDDDWETEDVAEDGQPSPDDTPLFRKDAFEIQVVESNDGRCLCDVPQSGWEGVVGETRYGKEAVEKVSVRMQVYFHIAEWLEENHQRFLREGPSGFGCALCTQQHLLDGPLRDVVDKTFLSRCLTNVDLVWPSGALPLRKCFGD